MLDGTGAVSSSPSGMFWDDLRADSLFGDHFWPDTSWLHRNRWHVEASGLGSAANRAFADGKKTRWGVGATSDFRYGSVFVRNVLNVDSRYSHDPAYPWKQDRGAAGRIAEAYVQTDWKYGFLRLGRLNRNWGPFRDRSLILSSAPYSYDALEWQLTAPFLEYRHLFAALPYSLSRLDTDGSMQVNRYLTAHSLNLIVGSWATFGVTEAVLFGNRNGFPDLQYVNPVAIYFVTNTNAESAGNLMVGLQGMVHPFTRAVTVKGQVIIDDIQVDNRDSTDQEPNHWGGDFGVYWQLPASVPGCLALEYRYLSRWLYLVSDDNRLNGERYTYLGAGLGFPRNDGDRWHVGYTVVGANFWAASVGASYERRGGNTLTSLWNTPYGWNGYRTETSLRSDSTERTVGLEIGGLGYLGRYADVSVSLDNRWVRNKDNIRSARFVYDPVISVTVSAHYPDFYWPF
jgi:hypothetical protein